jgi:hypothetical protein
LLRIGSPPLHRPNYQSGPLCLYLERLQTICKTVRNTGRRSSVDGIQGRIPRDRWHGESPLEMRGGSSCELAVFDTRSACSTRRRIQTGIPLRTTKGCDCPPNPDSRQDETICITSESISGLARSLARATSANGEDPRPRSEIDGSAGLSGGVQCARGLAVAARGENRALVHDSCDGILRHARTNPSRLRAPAARAHTRQAGVRCPYAFSSGATCLPGTASGSNRWFQRAA